MNKYDIIKAIERLDNKEFKEIERALLGILSQCSVRTRNVIRNAGGIQDFCVSYLFSNISEILKIRNCGSKSAKELSAYLPTMQSIVIEYFVNLANQSGDDNPKESITFTFDDPANDVAQEKENVPIVDCLSKRDLEIIGTHYNDLTNSKSVRVQNALRLLSIEDFITKFIDREEPVLSLKKIGRKSLTEISEIIDTIRNDVERALSSDISDDVYTQKQLLSRYNGLLDDYVTEFVKAHNHMPMLYLMSKTFERYADTVMGDVIIHKLGVLKWAKDLTLQDIASKHDLSRERVRQIFSNLKKFILDFNVPERTTNKLFQTYSMLINNKDDWQYLNDCVSDSLIINEYNIEDAIKNECSTLSKRFVLHLLAHQLSQSFAQLPSKQHEADGFPIQYSILISRKVAEIFDFEKFRIEFDKILEDLYEDWSFTIQELVYQKLNDVWINFSPEYIYEIEKILSHILIDEYNIIPNWEGMYIIECKKTIKATDIVYRILRDEGEPMHIRDIYNQILTIYPDRWDSAEKIRPILQNDKRIAAVGRNSVFALVEWKHVKFGSIRDLIVEYLSKYDMPQHVSAITKYVVNFADTSEKNIRSTMGSGKQFMVFENGFYGLSDRTYPDEFKILDDRRSTEGRISDFEAFLIREGHFPFASSEDPEEEALCNWWRRTNFDKISDTLHARFNLILEKYKDLPKDKRSFKWVRKCTEYATFVKSYGRRPNPRKESEVDLCEWYARVVRDFNDCKLTIDQERRFVELCNLF